MSRNHSWTRWSLTGVGVAALLAFLYLWVGGFGRGVARLPLDRPGLGAGPWVRLASYEQGGGPSLAGGTGWINSGPIDLAELRGKIVLLDFWTFCCINCHHILRDLAKLEEKYKDELVVIGVHTAKFEAERDTENIRRKVREYRIKHPVVNDANQVIWTRFGVTSWPTLVIIDPSGKYLGSLSGEGHYEQLDRYFGQLVERHKARGDLSLTPLKFNAEMERPSNGPLLFPGKIVADAAGNRLFISDTGHNRIIESDLQGAKPVVIGDGQEGFQDGAYAKARFNRPQGMCLDGEVLYIADTENHAIRAVDLKAQTVTTVAGVGTQSPRMHAIPFVGPAKQTALSSPWDIIRLPDEMALYIAMAGPHQIWKLNLETHTIGVFAGTGREGILDGAPRIAWFAQPSGLATDGENLYVADSEVSGVRAITGIRAHHPIVHTVVGTGLFDYDDRDGQGRNVRLQHCLGLAHGDGHLYIADTYNNRVKVCDPQTKEVKALVGAHEPGESDDPPRFYEPGGLSVAGTSLYVADTNNHKIRVVDLKTNTAKTLSLTGLTPPRPARHAPSFARAKVMSVPAVEAPAGNAVKLAVSIPLAKGEKLNEEVPMAYLVETPGQSGILAPEVPAEGDTIKPPTTEFSITVPLVKPAAAGDSLELRLSLQTFVCSEASSLCKIVNYRWNVPVTFGVAGGEGTIRLSTDMK
jgi:DNA-binding beta-propeller fold protein YncE